MVGILGRKIGMTQVFKEDGEIVPVTVIEGGPCCVVQIKAKKTDGYNAIQLGFEEVKASKLSKPLREKFKKIKAAPRKFIREFIVADPKDYQLGQHIDVTQFSPGDFVDVVGTSRGMGFQGGVKRWHWKIGAKSHGGMSHREPGSIGASAYPSRVFKGHHLPGQMGNQRVTIQGLEVVKTDKDNNLLVVKGSVPGHKNCYLIIKESRKPKKPKLIKKEAESKEKGSPRPKK